MDKKRVSIIAMIIGLITLVGGVVFLIIRLTAGPSVADGEFLVSIGKWKKDGEECIMLNCEDGTNCLGEDGTSEKICLDGNVVWDFTEIGKGILTTNNHINDYNFIWAIEDGKLKIETEWLYALENEYAYTLDQNAKTMTLKNGNEEIKFVPLNN